MLLKKIRILQDFEAPFGRPLTIMQQCVHDFLRSFSVKILQYNLNPNLKLYLII